jgi:hypothetical protein
VTRFYCDLVSVVDGYGLGPRRAAGAHTKSDTVVKAFRSLTVVSGVLGLEGVPAHARIDRDSELVD